METIYLETITDVSGVGRKIREEIGQRLNVVTPDDPDDPRDLIQQGLIESSLCAIVVGEDWNRSKYWLTTVFPEAKRLGKPLIALNADDRIEKHGFRSWFESEGVPIVDGDPAYIAGYLTGMQRSFEYEAEEALILAPDFKLSVASLSETIALELKKNPNAIRNLTPRQFEELVAELMEKSGYDVTLTQESRDNGVDIYAVKTDGFGRFLTIVDCKKYREDRTIGIEVVRGMIGTLQIEDASHAMLATTSQFSSVCTDFEKRHEYLISLQDHSDIVKWATANK